MLSIRTTLSIILGVFALTFAGCAAEIDDVGGAEAELGQVDCSAVRCAYPDCGENQRLVQSAGQCCPRCGGQPDDVGPNNCALVLCAAVVCNGGEERVFRGPNDCCGSCEPIHPARECTSDADCTIYCLVPPCDVGVCRGGECHLQSPHP